MKSLIITLISLLVVFTTFSQSRTLTLCEAFPLLEQAAENGFSDFKLNRDTTRRYTQCHFSSIEIAEGEGTRIEESMGNISFRTEIGQYRSLEAATDRINEMITALQSCYPTFRFNSFQQDVTNYTLYSIAKYDEKGFRLYEANFQISGRGSRHNVSFVFHAAKKAGFGNEADKPSFADYTLIDAKPDNAKFSQDLLKVMQHARNGFADIRGEQIPSNFYLFTDYKSTFQVSGHSKCYIEDRTMNVVNFIIPAETGNDESSRKKALTSTLKKISSALGPDYAYSTSADQKITTFVHKDQPHKKLLSMIFTVFPNKKFNLKIYVDANFQ